MGRQQGEGASRLGLRLLTGIAWLGWIAILMHESSEPTVFGRWSFAYAVLVLLATFVAIAVSFAHFERPRRFLRRCMIASTAIAITTFLSLLILEAAVRILDPIGISYYEESKRYQLTKQPHDELIYAHPRNWDGTFQDVRVSINELGFRDDPVEPRQEDELRILLLGDSLAFGWGVEREKIFARQIEIILEEQLGRPVEVINTGVGSYNTVQEEAVVRKFGDRLAPDVILLLFVYNDFEVHERPYDPHAQYETADLNLFGYASLLVHESWLYRLVRHVGFVWSPVEAEAGAEEDDQDLPGRPAAMNALRGIDAWADEHSIPFVTFVCGVDEWEDDWIIEALREVGAERSFPVVEAVPAWFKLREHRLSAVDSHPNAAGHRILAEKMSAFLIEAGWVEPSS